MCHIGRRWCRKTQLFDVHSYVLRDDSYKMLTWRWMCIDCARKLRNSISIKLKRCLHHSRKPQTRWIWRGIWKLLRLQNPPQSITVNPVASSWNKLRNTSVWKSAVKCNTDKSLNEKINKNMHTCTSFKCFENKMFPKIEFHWGFFLFIYKCNIYFGVNLIH